VDYLMTGLVVWMVWFAILSVIGRAVAESPENESSYHELAGYVSIGMLAIEVALLIGFIWI